MSLLFILLSNNFLLTIMRSDCGIYLKKKKRNTNQKPGLSETTKKKPLHCNPLRLLNWWLFLANALILGQSNGFLGFNLKKITPEISWR
jgi:hypothetical protein